MPRIAGVGGGKRRRDRNGPSPSLPCGNARRGRKKGEKGGGGYSFGRQKRGTGGEIALSPPMLSSWEAKGKRGKGKKKKNCDVSGDTKREEDVVILSLWPLNPARKKERGKYFGTNIRVTWRGVAEPGYHYKSSSN